MDDKLFAELIKSASQAVEIVRGDRKPSPTFEVTLSVRNQRFRFMPERALYRLQPDGLGIDVAET